MQDIIGGSRGKRRVTRPGVLFPIGARLVIVFAVILFVVLTIMNTLVSETASQDLLAIADEDNFTVNSRSALEVENRINAVRGNVHILLDLIRITGKDSVVAGQAAALFFERSHHIAAVIVPGYAELINERFFTVNEINPGLVSLWVSRQASLTERAARGEPVIINPSAEFKTPLTAMFYPWQQNGLEEAVIILFSPDGLEEIFGTGHNSSFMVNMDGDVLVHADYRMVMNNSNVSNHPLLAALSTGGARDVRLIYTEDGTKFFGAGKKLSLGGLMIFTSVEYDLPFRRTSPGIRRNNFIIITVVFLSAILIWLLSKTITGPLNRLARAMARVGAGNFDAGLTYRFPDEIGALTGSFTKMEAALEKREKFLDSCGRFTGPSAAPGEPELSAAPVPGKKPAAPDLPPRRSAEKEVRETENPRSPPDPKGKKSGKHSGKKPNQEEVHDASRAKNPGSQNQAAGKADNV